MPNVNATARGSDPTTIFKAASDLEPSGIDNEAPERTMINNDKRLNIADRMIIVRESIPLLRTGFVWCLNAAQFRYTMVAVNASKVNIIVMAQLTVNPVIIVARFWVRWQNIPVAFR